MSDDWDCVVIGAGPAGLAAATLLAEQQARVLLLDEQAAPGGQIYRAIEQAARRPDLLAALGPDYAYGTGLVERFRRSTTDYRPGSLVWQVTADREVWFSQAGRSQCVQAGTVILATGAMERPVPVPGWTLPGVLTVGGAQILLKTAGLVADEPLVLAGSGPLLYLLAQQTQAAGGRIAALLDTTVRGNTLAAAKLLPAALFGGGRHYLAKGMQLIAALRRAGVPTWRHVTDIRIEGSDAVTGVTFRSGGADHKLAAKLVALHEGVIPAQQIARSIGCAFTWDATQHYFAPQVDAWGNSSVAQVLIAGDGGGIGGARAAEHGGRLAALEALRHLGRVNASRRDAMARQDQRGLRRHLAVRRLLDTLYAPREEILRPADGVMVCRCEEIKAGAIRGVARQGCLGPNQAKAYLRAGMGPCQGRMCGPVVAELIAEARGVSVTDVGYYRIRPPLKPIPLSEIAALDA